MSKINLNKMSKADLNRLGAAAETVTYDTTRPLTARDRRQLAQAARKGGRGVIAG